MNRKIRKFDRLIRKIKMNKSEEITHLVAEIKFDDEELQGIRTDFQEVFARRLNIATVIKYHFCYEIHYRLDGYNVTVVDTDLKRAKEKFRERLLA